MGPVQAIKASVAKSFTFSGRACRSEFWWFFAAWFSVTLVLLFLVGWTKGFLWANWSMIVAWKTFKVAVFLTFFFPLASTARRHHDAGFPAALPVAMAIPAVVMMINALIFVPLLLGFRSPGLMYLLLIDGNAFLAFLTLMALALLAALWPSQPFPNRYGPPPKVTP